MRGLRASHTIAGLATIATLSYGAILYSFSVFISGGAAGAEFSTSLLSAAFGGSVLTGSLAAVAVGRIADHRGVREIMIAGTILAGAGLAGFAAAQEPWQLLGVWWLVLGPATAMTSYEPCFVAISEHIPPERRHRSIGILTLVGGLAGPIFIPVATYLVGSLGWRPTATIIGAIFAVVGGSAGWLLLPPAAEHGHRPGHHPRHGPPVGLVLRSPLFLILTAAAVLALGSLEGLLVHRVAHFEEGGFALSNVAWWAAGAGILSLPGRFLLPLAAERLGSARVFAGTLLVMAAATAAAVQGTHPLALVGHFVLSGLVYGAVIPLRALVMTEQYAGATFGSIMGIQAAATGLARAGGPWAIGTVRDAAESYRIPMTWLAIAFVLAGAMSLAGGRSRTRATRDQASSPDTHHAHGGWDQA